MPRSEGANYVVVGSSSMLQYSGSTYDVVAVVVVVVAVLVLVVVVVSVVE